jgi:hypothetical protein
MGWPSPSARALAGGLRRAPRCGRRGALGDRQRYGASDEWHQSFVPGRSADVHDWSPTRRRARSARRLLGVGYNSSRRCLTTCPQLRAPELCVNRREGVA